MKYLWIQKVFANLNPLVLTHSVATFAFLAMRQIPENNGADHKFWQCGLPKKMALELFKPFIMKKLVEQGNSYNIKGAKRMVNRRIFRHIQSLDQRDGSEIDRRWHD